MKKQSEKFTALLGIFLTVYPHWLFADATTYQSQYPNCVDAIARAERVQGALNGELPRIQAPWRKKGTGETRESKRPKIFFALELAPELAAPQTRAERSEVRRHFLRGVGYSSDGLRAKDVQDNTKFNIACPIVATPVHDGRMMRNWDFHIDYERDDGTILVPENMPGTVLEEERLLATKLYLRSPNGDTIKLSDSPDAIEKPDVLLIGIDQRNKATTIRLSEFVAKFVNNLADFAEQQEKLKRKLVAEEEARAAGKNVPDRVVVAPERSEVVRSRRGDAKALLAELKGIIEDEELTPIESLTAQVRIIAEYFEQADDEEEAEIARMFLTAVSDAGLDHNTENWKKLSLYYEINGLKTIRQIRTKIAKHLRNTSKTRLTRSLAAFQKVTGTFSETYRTVVNFLGNRGGDIVDRSHRTFFGHPMGTTLTLIGAITLVILFGTNGIPMGWLGQNDPVVQTENSGNTLSTSPRLIDPDPQLRPMLSGLPPVELLELFDRDQMGHDFVVVGTAGNSQIQAVDPYNPIYASQTYVELSDASGTTSRYRIRRTVGEYGIDVRLEKE